MLRLGHISKIINVDMPSCCCHYQTISNKRKRVNTLRLHISSNLCALSPTCTSWIPTFNRFIPTSSDHLPCSIRILNTSNWLLMRTQNVFFASIEVNSSNFSIGANTESRRIIMEAAIEYHSTMFKLPSHQIAVRIIQSYTLIP